MTLSERVGDVRVLGHQEEWCGGDREGSTEGGGFRSRCHLPLLPRSGRVHRAGTTRFLCAMTSDGRSGGRRGGRVPGQLRLDPPGFPAPDPRDRLVAVGRLDQRRSGRSRRCCRCRSERCGTGGPGAGTRSWARARTGESLTADRRRRCPGSAGCLLTEVGVWGGAPRLVGPARQGRPVAGWVVTVGVELVFPVPGRGGVLTGSWWWGQGRVAA